ncbi:ATP-binding cassette subfamily B protein [Stackebrandtia albiflava]|uniref:ATP-binding cassette subfamily B protein n=2 Tax=Stackebrandtia albiflava TaxID=406432 RepID=A0A562VD65_9ACTN|nr:ATP-binding cassette subfamily B protein [Stackebrandtia albiflava]
MVHMGGPGFRAMRSMTRDRTLAQTKLTKGMFRRIVRFAAPYRRDISVFLVTVVLSAAIGVATPVLAGDVVNEITGDGDRGVVVRIAVLIGGLAVVEALLSLANRWYSAKVGEGMIYRLRREVFGHVQSMPLAFFSRTQTGALVSRLNNDVLGAQRAFTSTLSGLVSNAIAVVLTLAVMLSQSWQITLLSLVLVPVFLIPARMVGRRLATLTNESFELNASMNAQMTERFGVGGALLVKLFGRPQLEVDEFARRADRVRSIGVTTAMYARTFIVALTMVAGLAQAVTYGLGGWFALSGTLTAGTVVTLALLLTRLYGPLTALSNVRVDVMSALVSFQRVFEVLDLEPLITDAPDARPVPPGPVEVEFDDVVFRYPTASQVSLASLEDVARLESAEAGTVLDGVSFTVRPGTVVALVGHSGAGKTTTSMLVPRVYDVASGAVRINGQDVRDTTAQSLKDTVGVVTQDSHMFHDTIRANLAYGRLDADDEAMWDALERAQIAPVIRRLPDGLDTVVGERGYRFSGGEKQRLAIARLLLKSPGMVILDEATAHLDSESEAALQVALSEALAGRTALVIAHRLSTVRDADEIVVLHEGRVAERGSHEELVARGGIYSELYRTQFTRDTATPGDR